MKNNLISNIIRHNYSKFVLMLLIISIVSGCATTSELKSNTDISRVYENSNYSVNNRETFENEISNVIQTMNEGYGYLYHFDKKDKNSIKMFMEQTKNSMMLCQSAIDTQNISKRTMLVACEPFFKDLELARYGRNEIILSRYGMGTKIAIAILGGVAAGAAYNSNDFGTIVAGTTVAITAATLSSIPNDWKVISPYMTKVEASAYNKWLVLHINETDQSDNH